MQYPRLLTLVMTLLAFATPTILQGQYDTGTIAGTVQDQSGAAVSGAAITALQLATGVSRQTTANAQGEFVFNSMSPGKYGFTIMAKGFKSQQLTDLTLTTGQTLSVPPVKLYIVK